MTDFDIQSVAHALVTPQAMTAAIRLAAQIGDDVTPNQLLHIARTHGGDALIASALHLRLSLMAMLLRVEPALVTDTAELSPETVGTVLADFPIDATAKGIAFDGDALAAALRLETEPRGVA